MNSEMPIIKMGEKTSCTLDSLNILDTSVLLEVCPFLKDLKMIFSVSVGHKKQALQRNPRHITPVSNIDHANFKQKKEIQLQVKYISATIKNKHNTCTTIILMWFTGSTGRMVSTILSE